MPSEKRTAPKDDANIAKKKKTKELPFDLHFEKLNKKARDVGALGALLIKGFPDEDDSDDEDKTLFTKDDMDTLRHVLITKNREQQLNAMEKLVLGEQAGKSTLMFTTSFSYGVRDGFDSFQLQEYRIRSKPEKFDKLFAYTYQLMQNDVWMHDNEGGMDDMVKELAEMWKKLLKNDDKKLGIDSEYTRPGVVQLLQDFKEEIESHHSEPPFEFCFQ